jgi:hypothetical protein
VIASDKQHTPGHRARYNFVERLKQYFGERLDVFGWGGLEIPDKWDGIAPYKYHIAIENSAQPDYWTEKLSDAYLAGAFPIYHGAQNITDYFPADCLQSIDINKVEASIAKIEDILKSNAFNAKRLKNGRDLVLEKYNLFALCAEFIRSRQANRIEITQKIKPAHTFVKPLSRLKRAISAFRQTFRGQ